MGMGWYSSSVGLYVYMTAHCSSCIFANKAQLVQLWIQVTL